MIAERCFTVSSTVGRFEFSVQDDGAGCEFLTRGDRIQNEKVFESIGVASMMDRAGMLGARLEFGKSSMGGLEAKLLIKKEIDKKTLNPSV